MFITRQPDTQSGQQIYHIRLEGYLDTSWTDWFEGSSITLEKNTTLLICTVTDQPELFGLLRKVRDLGLPLISVTRV